MAISSTTSRNIYAAITRAARHVWFGELDDTDIPPLGLNNENIRLAPNAANTDYVVLKVNASDQIEIPTATLKATGGFSPAAGISTYGGGFPNAWALNYTPIATTTGTSTQGVSHQQFIAAVWVPVNQTLTGIAYLIGTTGGTDKAIVALYDSAGTLVANSTVTASGVTVGTAATIQSVPFTATYAAKGPGLYYASVQLSGTTAFVRTIPLGVGNCSKTVTNTGATPAATITAPTSFVADAAVICSLY